MAPTCASGSRSFNLASSAVLRADEVVWIPRPPGAIVHFGLKSAPSRRDFRPGRKSISKLVAWLSLSKQQVEDHRASTEGAAGAGRGREGRCRGAGKQARWPPFHAPFGPGSRSG